VWVGFHFGMKARCRRSTVFQYVACIRSTLGGGIDRELAGSNARVSGSSAYHWSNWAPSSARAARFADCDGGRTGYILVITLPVMTQSVATLRKAGIVRLGTGLKSTAAGSDPCGAQSSSASSSGGGVSKCHSEMVGGRPMYTAVYLSALTHAHHICFLACSSSGVNILLPFICQSAALRWRPKSWA